MSDPHHDQTQSPAPPATVEYATPAPAGPRRGAGTSWAGAAAIALAACALTFGVVYWSMDRLPRRPQRRVWVPVPLGTQPDPFPQVLPGAGPVEPAPLAPGRAELARCAMRLQHIAAALQAWANRHDWRLPDRLEDLVAAGLLDRGDLVCPAGDSGTGSAAESAAYRYVGRGLKTPVAPDTVVVYEPPLHVGGLGMNVLFGDGGVRLLTGDDATRLSARAESGRVPVRYSPTTVPSGEKEN